MLALLIAAATAAPMAHEIAPYRSAFAAYRRFESEPPPRHWRRANDEVGRLGGHAGHLREDNRPTEAPPAPGADRKPRGAAK